MKIFILIFVLMIISFLSVYGQSEINDVEEKDSICKSLPKEPETPRESRKTWPAVVQLYNYCSDKVNYFARSLNIKIEKLKKRNMEILTLREQLKKLQNDNSALTIKIQTYEEGICSLDCDFPSLSEALQQP